MLVQNFLSKQAGWIMELNFSLKLLCFMLSQVLQMLILKYYFYAKEKNVQLLPRVGKMKQTLHSNWLPKGARWAHLAHLGFPALVPQVKVLFLAM